MEIKGNEKMIGGVAVVVVAILASILGLSSEAFKVGFCGEPQAPVAQAPAVTVLPVVVPPPPVVVPAAK